MRIGRLGGAAAVVVVLGLAWARPGTGPPSGPEPTVAPVVAVVGGWANLNGQLVPVCTWADYDDYTREGRPLTYDDERQCWKVTR